MPTYDFKLGVPSSADNQAIIRGFIDQVMAKTVMDEAGIAMLSLAVDEAVSNVIEHAYGSDPSKEVRVRVILDEDQVAIEIVDTGKGFEPGQVAQKDLKQLVAERRSGGLGMRIIQKVMDDVKYQIIPGEKNELRMVKRLKV
jgi:serine/threonine-protein kinase RsbW